MLSGYVFDHTTVAANVSEIMTPVADQLAFVFGKDFRIPSGMTMLAMGMAVGGGGKTFQLDSPELRQISRQWIVPPENSDQINGYGPTPYFLDNAPVVRPGESLNAYAEAGTVGDQTQLGVWLAQNVPSAVRGQNMRTIRGTTVGNFSAAAWTTQQITLDQDLPDGWYQLIGAKVVGGGQFARFIFPDSQNQRMMVPIVPTAETQWDQIFRYGKLGAWGKFENFVAPKIEIWGTAQTTGQTVYLDVVKMT